MDKIITICVLLVFPIACGVVYFQQEGFPTFQFEKNVEMTGKESLTQQIHNLKRRIVSGDIDSTGVDGERWIDLIPEMEKKLRDMK